MTYPREERRALIDNEAVDTYIRTLFRQARWRPDSFINLRGIGEKGTDREGVYSEDFWCQPGITQAEDGFDGDDMVVADAQKCALSWGLNNVATYIVPAVMREARGLSSAVESMPALLVDLDSGDTTAKAHYLLKHLGEPSIVVGSGGQTDAGKPKLHLYWVLDDVCEDVSRVVDLRHEIARKVGGDLSLGRGVDSNPYGRAHQPIRVPGSVHSKGDKPAAVQLRHATETSYNVDELAEKVRRMPDSPWAITDTARAGALIGFDFGPDKNHHVSAEDALTAKVYEGADEGAKTRYAGFNQAAGHIIRKVRDAELSVEDGRAAIHAWVTGHMEPPWPAARVDKEWRALCSLDIAKKGPFPVATVAQEHIEVSITRAEDSALGLREYAAHRWTKDEDTPTRRFVVQGLVQAGKPTLLVAEGGAGKTFAMLDLCLKVASRGEDEALTWLGQPIVCQGGTVVMLTTEDDTEELHIRLASLDSEGRRFRAGDRLIVVPAVNTPRGAFTFGDRDRATGNVVPSAGWREFVELLGQLPDLRLVVVDTLNTTLHGEENSATVINEYAKLLAPVCGKLKAALIVTHHVRKQDPKFPIKTTDDMAAAVRGSSALPAAFRAVLGLWHATDFGRLMQAVGLDPKPKMLWRFGVLKANNPEMLGGVRYLLRGKAGMLEDVTEKVGSAVGDERAQARAWLVKAIEAAADAGQPYLHASRDSALGLYGRRNELHPAIRGLGQSKLRELTDALIDAGDVVVRQVEWRDVRNRITAYPTLDVKHGRYDRTQPDRVEQATFEAPDWEGGWTFDPTTGEVLPRGAPRFVMNPE